MSSKSAPFSAHARGVPLFDRTRFSDVPEHAVQMLLHLRDMSSSSFWFLAMQSWTTMWSVFVVVFSNIFFTYYDTNFSLAADLDWSMIGFIVILPLVGFIWITYQRRERALDLASEAKVLMLHIWNASRLYITREHDSSIQPAVDTAIQTLLRAMHAYFLPARFYSGSYPYFGYKSALVSSACINSACYSFPCCLFFTR